MKRRYPSHLRLHTEDQSSASPSSLINGTARGAGIVNDEILECLKSFSEATSWGVFPRTLETESLDRTSSRPSGNESGSRSKAVGRRWRLAETIVEDGAIDPLETDVPVVSMERAQRLIHSIERLVERLETAEEAVRRQEAQLATAVGISSNSDRQRETADRFESILDSVSRSIGAVAAAIYLLDDDTSTLKMRSCIGLPKSRLSNPPRPLRGSLADLEALLGNAVLLSDIDKMPEWPSPEEFASALVVPIGSSTMPHGTMWFWTDTSRTYSATEIEVANLAAGRVMSEIEQSILGEEVHQSRVIQKQLDTASVTQASMLPDNQTLHEDYDINGWTYQNGSIGGAFHHWDVTPKSLVTVAIGNANQSGPDGAIVATSIHSIARSLWNAGSSPSQIMRNINDNLWSLQDADWTADLALVQFNPITGHGSLCNAGDIHLFVISHRGFRPLGNSNLCVASQPDTPYNQHRFVLQPGEILLGYTANILAPTSSGPNKPEPIRKRSNAKGPSNIPTSQWMDQNSLLQIVRDMSDESAKDISGFLARTMPTFERQQGMGRDRSLIVVKNVRKANR